MRPAVACCGAEDDGHGRHPAAGQHRENNMAETARHMDPQHAEALGRHYRGRFETDTFTSRPLWIRLLIEFLGTFLLVCVAAGAGVINHYAGGNPVTRAAAVIAPGALVMALIYAWGPLSGLHINPVVTLAFAARQVFRPVWVIPYWVA
jgi:aquaporin Z